MCIRDGPNGVATGDPAERQPFIQLVIGEWVPWGATLPANRPAGPHPATAALAEPAPRTPVAHVRVLMGAGGRLAQAIVAWPQRWKPHG